MKFLTYEKVVKQKNSLVKIGSTAWIPKPDVDKGCFDARNIVINEIHIKNILYQINFIIKSVQFYRTQMIVSISWVSGMKF